MRIVVNDIAASSGGAMTVLRDFYSTVCRLDHENEWIFLLNDHYFEETDNVKIIKMPQIKKSRAKKLIFDFLTGKSFVEKLSPDVVFSLQNIATFGIKTPQVVYIHQAIPFQNAFRFSFFKADEPYKAEELDCSVARSLFPEVHFNVVYAGNIGVMQNVDILLKAAEQMREETDIRFHIIGDGAYKEKLQKQAQDELLTNVTFHLMQSSHLAPSLHMTADVNVIPLVKNVYRTALPSKTATCLACGKPIIFAIGNESGFGQWMQKETGCLVASSDSAEELCQAIRRIKTGRTVATAEAVFIREFSKIKNSLRYTQILENM